MASQSEDFKLFPAEASDSHAIATLFVQSWVSPFARLQFGDIDPRALADSMATQIAAQIEDPTDKLFIVMRSASEEVVAVAQWTVPNFQESDTADDGGLGNLPSGSNKALVNEFMVSLRNLRHDTLQSRPHFLLENIATSPAFRGRGFASRLIEWVFPHADKMDEGRGVVVYLDTASDNPAMKLYKRLGFAERGQAVVKDLERFGGEGDHVHVAFTREPKGHAHD